MCQSKHINHKLKIKQRAKHLNEELMRCKSSVHDDKEGKHRKRAKLEQVHRKIVHDLYDKFR